MIYHNLNKIIFGGLLLLMVGSCQNDDGFSETQTEQDPPIEEQTEEYVLTRLDKTQRRVTELMTTVRQRADRLERWGEENSENIPEEVRLEKQRLINDLKRLEDKLDSTLTKLEGYKEEKKIQSEKAIRSQIETTEDELEQIDEELKEWRETNE